LGMVALILRVVLMFSPMTIRAVLELGIRVSWWVRSW
jgi:hypothetical protein